MQKLIKISETHYIVVDDSVPRPNDLVYSYVTKSITQFTDPRHFSDGTYKKITHSTQPFNFDFIEPLILSEVEELIYGYNAEKMAEERYPITKGGNMWMPTTHDCIQANKQVGYVEGFNSHKELVKDKLFTVEDMKKAMDFMYWFCQDVSNEYLEHNFGIKNAGDLNTNQAITVFIQSLLPKTEWECYFDEQGKLKLI